LDAICADAPQTRRDLREFRIEAALASQECELFADMLHADRPKIAAFVRYPNIEAETFLVSAVLVSKRFNLAPSDRQMKTLRILIVEDEPMVAMDLEMVVAGIVTAAVVVEASVAATKEVLHQALDFAFLDVDVINGKTYEIAHRFSSASVCRLFIFRARRKNSCLLTCAACPSFPSLFARLRLSVCCRLS
jgi:hypothetical protein